MWSYSQENGWSPFAGKWPEPRGGDYNEERTAAGYASTESLTLGRADDGGFGLTVFERWKQEAPSDYLVDVNLGGTIETVFIPELPDLLDFLRVYAPIADTFLRGEVKPQ